MCANLLIIFFWPLLSQILNVKKKKKTKLNIQSIFVPKTILEVSQRASGEAQIGSSKLVIREGLEIIKFT